MVTKLEKQFFKTFGIESKYEDGTCNMDDKCRNTCCDTCQRINKFNYPQITDHILLKLICILNTVTVPDLGDINTGRLKKTILEECINALTTVDWENRTPTKEEFINEIQTLFEEG